MLKMWRKRTYLVGTVVSGHDPVLFTLVARQLQKASLLKVPPNQQGLAILFLWLTLLLSFISET